MIVILIKKHYYILFKIIGIEVRIFINKFQIFTELLYIIILLFNDKHEAAISKSPAYVPNILIELIKIIYLFL